MSLQILHLFVPCIIKYVGFFSFKLLLLNYLLHTSILHFSALCILGICCQMHIYLLFLYLIDQLTFYHKQMAQCMILCPVGGRYFCRKQRKLCCLQEAGRREPRCSHKSHATSAGAVREPCHIGRQEGAFTAAHGRRGRGTQRCSMCTQPVKWSLL